MTRDETIAHLLHEAKRFGRLADRFVGAAPREGQARRAERDEAVLALRDAEKLLIGIVQERRAALFTPAPVAAPPDDLVATVARLQAAYRAEQEAGAVWREDGSEANEGAFYAAMDERLNAWRALLAFPLPEGSARPVGDTERLREAGQRLADAAERYADRLESEMPQGAISTVAQLWRLLAADWCAALASPAPQPAESDGSVMVRIDRVYVDAMRGDGLTGPFACVRLVEHEGEPRLELTTAPVLTPDTAEWWREVAQGLGVEIAKLKALVSPAPQPAADGRCRRCGHYHLDGASCGFHQCACNGPAPMELCKDGHNYRRNAPPQAGDVCTVCRVAVWQPGLPAHHGVVPSSSEPSR